MKVLVISGGSGSTEIQKGLKNYPIDLTILVNGYDNGKSTGLIRQVFNGKILGPSDIRKNQFLQYKLEHNDNLIEYLDHRFSSDNPQKYIENYWKDKNIPIFFKKIIQRYFENDNAHKIVYNDFSIGNIIYGQLAYENDFSMQKAADIMKEQLKISANIIVNSDQSLFLYAITESGKIITDEADIVDYNNKDDKIKNIYFLDENGNKIYNPDLSDRAIDEMNKSDLIIYSTGTQWSSLIPTYISKGFYDLSEINSYKSFLIMNSYQDKDMKGVDGTELYNILKKYISIDKMKVIIDENAIDGLNEVNEVCNCYHLFLSNKNNKHDGNVLIKNIFNIYFKQPQKHDMFIFDLDDTLIERIPKNIDISHQNLEYLKNLPNKMIVTGNTIKTVPQNFNAYADGGLNYYENHKFVKCINENLKIKSIEKIIEMLSKYGFAYKIDNRNDTCLSIKPIKEHRKIICEKINDELKKIDNNLIAKEAGNTTIDIMHKDSDKIFAVKDIIKNYNQRIFYIGDEFKNGNDSLIFKKSNELGITFIKVNDVLDTNIFLKSIED